ncbi:4-coumarate--CoA ligase 1-like [Drosophila novamexicana]|uniref:4-coumarate--CoA ligase 1-like n=1 Tax=Drosophila novamexicana TaxID=47314 RepID=UPI0011E58EB9|nr:4-coumarate--CoA ligase 1-like [Drosophila novamexicana]
MECNWNSTDKIWSCPGRSTMYSPNTSVGRIIFNTMRNWPKNVCQISDTDGVSLTSEHALTWAIRMAQHFKKRGLDDSSVIGIAARNTTYIMPLGVACLLNATPFHSINPILDEATIKFMFEITKPALIFCDKQEYRKVYAATKDWQPEIFIIDEPMDGVPNIRSLLEFTTTEKFYQPELLKSSDQTVAILCSSGTTGMPKAVCISNSVLLTDNMLVNSESIFFINSGLDWITGLWAFMFSAVFGSTRILTTKPFSPEYFIELVKKYKINYVTMAPVHLAALVASPAATPYALSSLRNVNYGGGIASDATLKRIQALCKDATLNSAYAMTEVGLITMNFGIQNTATAGRPIPGISIRIVDENGKSLGHNEVGEIYVHTGKDWNGYYGNPVATRQIRDLQGWIHSGDLGYFDDQNYLYIVDRKKEVLKYQGIHYWPTEIENAIRELPQVRDVCVVGVPHELLGDAAGALVIKTPGCTISPTDIANHVAKRLPSINKQLHAGVKFTDKLPVNHNGKAMRKAALELFVSLAAEK